MNEAGVAAEFPRDAREAAFFAAIASSPNAEDARSVYADWLEDRADAAYAESLRIDTRLCDAEARSCADVRILAKDLARLRTETDPAWRAAILRWSTEQDFTALPLPKAMKKIRRSKHGRAPEIGARISEWVESMGAEGDDDPYGIVRVYEKNVAIAANFETSSNAVAILGDLVIGKQYTDLIDYDQSLLAVAGNIHCAAVWQLGELFVAGNLVCEGVIYGSSFRTNRGEVLGDVRSRVIVENGHHFVFHGNLESEVRIGDAISVNGSYVDELNRERLDPSLLDQDGNLDEKQLYERICAGNDCLVVPEAKHGRRS